MCGGGSMDFIGRAEDAVSDAWDSVEDTFSDVWDNVEDIGKDVAGAAVGSLTWGFTSIAGVYYGAKHSDEIYYSLSGQKYKDEKALGAMGEDLNNLAGQISALQDRLGNKVFLEQIFKYGDIRRIKGLGTDYEQLLKDYEALLADYKNNTDVGFIGGLVLFIPNVVSALVYNILDYIKTGDEASLRAALTIGLLIAAIVVSILALIPSGGASSVTLMTAIAATLTIISAVLALDAMVNNSGLLGAAFRVLDVVLNKVFQADKYTNSEGFDRDSHYYQTMMNNTRLAFQIAAIVASLGTAYQSYISGGASSAGTAASRMAARNADFGAYAGGVASGQTLAMQTSAGLAGSSGISAQAKAAWSYKVGGTVSLSDLYQAYETATSINDSVAAFGLKAELDRKLSEAKDKTQDKISKDNRRKFEASYADAAYLANQTDMSYHAYVLQMSEAGQSDVYDPEGTIVMNTRYSPKRSYSFGFEDMFEYEGMAGGELYVYNTLWK